MNFIQLLFFTIPAFAELAKERKKANNGGNVDGNS